MRSKKAIQTDGSNKQDLLIEVLLDIRDLLKKPVKKKRKKKEA